MQALRAASPRVRMQLQQTSAPVPTTNHLMPLWIHPIHFSCPKVNSLVTQEHREYPHLIVPDDDDLIMHRYPLRSQPQANSLIQTVRRAFAGVNSCNTVVDETTEDLQEYRHLMCTPARKIWDTALANNLVRLAQGVGARMPKGNSPIRFVCRQAVPAHKKIMYARLVAKLRQPKKEVHQVRLTVGGNMFE